MSLLLNGMNNQELKERTVRAPYSRVWARLVSRWEAMAARKDVQDGSFSQANLRWPGCTPRVIDAALVYCLTGRADALQYVELMIERLLIRYHGIKQAESPETFKTDNAGQRPSTLSHSEIALAADLVREDLHKETRMGLCRIMRDCIIPFTSFEHALGGYSSGGNVACCQHINAGIAALAWGEESGYPDWEKVVWQAAENARQYLRHGCDEAGFPYEGSGYGHSVFLYIYEYAQLLKQNNIRDLFNEEPVLGKIPDASRQMLLDNHLFIATTNDHGPAEPWTMPWLLLTSRYYHRPDHMGLWHAFSGPDHPVRPYGDIWPWLADSGGHEASKTMYEKPDISLVATFLWWDADAPVVSLENSFAPLAQCAAGTGTATFRSSWKPDCVFAALLGAGRSHTCFGHAHRDCGHFDISAYGDYLAIDTGRYNFHEEQHSVVMIDGKDAHSKKMCCDQRSGRLLDFEHGKMVDYCKADAAHMKNCRWADRHFLFVRTDEENSYIVIVDNILPDDARMHEYWWQMQVHPEADVTIQDDYTACVTGKNARLDVSFFAKDEPHDASRGKHLELKQDIQEWVWPYGREQDVSDVERQGILLSSVRRPRLLAIQRRSSCCLATLVSPRRKDAPPRSVRQFGEGNFIGLDINDGEYNDTILIALDHAYINTPAYYGLCEFAVVRRNNDGLILDQWTKKGMPLTIKKQSSANCIP